MCSHMFSRTRRALVPRTLVTAVLLTPQLAGMAHAELGPPIGSLAEHRGMILAAMDFLLKGL